MAPRRIHRVRLGRMRLGFGEMDVFLGNHDFFEISRSSITTSALGDDLVHGFGLGRILLIAKIQLHRAALLPASGVRGVLFLGLFELSLFSDSLSNLLLSMLVDVSPEINALEKAHGQ